MNLVVRPLWLDTTWRILGWLTNWVLVFIFLSTKAKLSERLLRASKAMIASDSFMDYKSSSIGLKCDLIRPKISTTRLISMAK
jgi:hypothetical protein